MNDKMIEAIVASPPERDELVGAALGSGPPWGQTEFQVNLKLGLTSRKKARERRIVGSLKPFTWNPAGNQSRPVEPDQQPEASLAWWVGNYPCEA